MGWLFTRGLPRKDLIADRAKSWERTTDDGLHVTSTCLAHCYRGGVYSGVLWCVWELTFAKDEHPLKPVERWITCDLLRFQKDYGWGYKDMEESMHPYFYSCPLRYLEMVPIDQYGGHATWREGVREYHARQAEKRRQRKCA